MLNILEPFLNLDTALCLYFDADYKLHINNVTI